MHLMVGLKCRDPKGWEYLSGLGVSSGAGIAKPMAQFFLAVTADINRLRNAVLPRSLPAASLAQTF